MVQIMHLFIPNQKLSQKILNGIKSNKPKKIYSLIVNTRNANCFTGKQGYKSLEKIADLNYQQF